MSLLASSFDVDLGDKFRGSYVVVSCGFLGIVASAYDVDLDTYCGFSWRLFGVPVGGAIAILL